jgi:hypothetical protein
MENTTTSRVTGTSAVAVHVAASPRHRGTLLAAVGQLSTAGAVCPQLGGAALGNPLGAEAYRFVGADTRGMPTFGVVVDAIAPSVPGPHVSRPPV